MAIILYKCDTCKREIELQQNKKGLETFQRCIITHGCRGKLYQTAVLQDYIRASLPARVDGLLEWQQRKILHNHTQSIESTEWNITHNLGTYPSISVFVNRSNQDGSLEQVEITPTDITIIDSDIIKIAFSRPESGIAQLVGRASDPQLLQPTITNEVVELETQQVSTNNEISLATLSAAASINVTLTFTTNEGITFTQQYTVDDQPSIKSPWNDFNKIIIRGKIYTIRSFDFLTPILSDIQSGAIPNGSLIRITGISEQYNTILLLTNEPYENVDKITNKLIDTFDISGEENLFSFYLNNTQIDATETIIQSVHPAIYSL